MAGEVSKHKPVNVTDPDSNCQIVGLRPHQPLRVRLTKRRYASIDVKLDSRYVEIKNVVESDQYFDYDIGQTPHAEGRNACSTFFLGDLQVNEHNLILYLNNDYDPYKNTITTVCPKKSIIRIKPYQYVEVVLMSEGMPTFDSKWDWHWVPGKDNIGVEEIGYRFIYSAFLQNNNVECYPFNMMGHSDDGRTMQHHYWFRCEREILSLLPSCERGVYLGNLIFCRRHVTEDAMVPIYIDVHRRYQSETEEALKGITSRLYAVPQRPQFYGPVCRSITLQEIEFKDLDDGCRTVGGEDAGVQGEETDNVADD
jgi:hypothetical protein